MEYSRTSVSQRRTLPPAVAVSTVAFALHPPAGAQLGMVADTSTTIWLPLVRRTRPPYRDHWALPGGPIPWNETLVDTALRTLSAAVLREPGYLEQLYSFGEVERSADAQRLVTIAYWALYGEAELAHDPRAEHPADPNVAWFSADRLPDLAFDHSHIVSVALGRLRTKTEYSAVTHRLLGPAFTISQLRSVHEAILGEHVDPANFRRQTLAQGNLVETGDMLPGGRHRPARLYRFHETAEGNESPRLKESA